MKIIVFITTSILIIVLSLFFFVFDPEDNSLHVNENDVIDKWAKLFDPSVLTYNERYKELLWFKETAAPFKGMSITSVGEDIETSFWESQYLARAFEELTGIKVDHDVIGEGDVVVRLMEQTEDNKYHYDIYVNDADLIGTHLRSKKIVVLSDYMKNEGNSFTNPMLDMDDFLNLKSGQDYEGNQLQLPDYQFVMLYWFRYDWFSNPNIKKEFKETYGYELGVPQNWAAYEDIAKFFTGKKMKNPNDSEVIAYGHADTASIGPWLGWRFSDAFMANAGMGDIGLPNGIPVDEWGIRVENKIPVGASVQRGGSINGPAAVYALTKWLEFLEKYAPKESYDLNSIQFGALPARGDIAQTWFWPNVYGSMYKQYNKVGSPVCDKEGNPVWRVAPVPTGKYWQTGMKMGYMDLGSWTIPKSTKGDKRAAAWLWAQFCLSKSVALKKFTATLTPVRKSTLNSLLADKSKKDLGGLIEFFRSPIIKNYTDSGPNVPNYPKMSALWWKNMAMAVEKKKTPQEALDHLAFQLDSLIGALKQNQHSSKLNPVKSKKYWLDKKGSPKHKIIEREAPKTIPYEELLRSWEK